MDPIVIRTSHEPCRRDKLTCSHSTTVPAAATGVSPPQASSLTDARGSTSAPSSPTGGPLAPSAPCEGRDPRPQRPSGRGRPYGAAKRVFGARGRDDFAASLVVFLVALPLCVGVAVASGVPAELGLVTGIVGGLVTGLLPGSSLQVSGPAAGLTVLVYEAVTAYGLAGLGVLVLAAGLLQLLMGVLRLGRWFRAISVAVVQGMLAGIGLLLIAGQLYVMADREAPDYRACQVRRYARSAGRCVRFRPVHGGSRAGPRDDRCPGRVEAPP